MDNIQSTASAMQYNELKRCCLEHDPHHESIHCGVLGDKEHPAPPPDGLFVVKPRHTLEGSLKRVREP